MASRKVQIDQGSQRNDEPQFLSDGLRGWIERVVVPILVKEFIWTKGLQKEVKDG